MMFIDRTLHFTIVLLHVSFSLFFVKTATEKLTYAMFSFLRTRPYQKVYQSDSPSHDEGDTEGVFKQYIQTSAQ